MHIFFSFLCERIQKYKYAGENEVCFQLKLRIVIDTQHELVQRLWYISYLVFSGVLLIIFEILKYLEESKSKFCLHKKIAIPLAF